MFMKSELASEVFGVQTVQLVWEEAGGGFAGGFGNGGWGGGGGLHVNCFLCQLVLFTWGTKSTM